MPDGTLLTTAEAAKRVRLAKRTLEDFRCKGGGPIFRKLGGRVLYRVEDLDSWVNSRGFSSTTEAQAAAAA